MFSRWGAFVYRFRRPVAILAVVIAIASSFLAAQASSALSSGGWLDANSESAEVAARLDSDYGSGKSSMIALFRSDTPGADATSDAFQGAIADHDRGPGRQPGRLRRRGLRRDGRQAVHQHGRRRRLRRHRADRDRTRRPWTPSTGSGRTWSRPAGYSYQLTGYGPITKDGAAQSEKDLQKAELVSLPIAALVLILVFASIVAAGLPLLVAGLAIPSTMALIFIVAQQVEMSIYVLNIATMLGLALAIDYSLFIVSRYREELRRGRTVGEAVERAVATSGKAVMFSGIAVAIGLSGLLLFAAPAIRSIGIAGALVVISSVFFALTFLPAVLGMLGPRVNALPLSGISRRFRRTSDLPFAARTSRWERVALAVMKHPIRVMIPTLAILLIAGIPYFHMVQGVPGRRGLPARRREPRRLRRAPDRVRAWRDDAHRHPRRRRERHLADGPRHDPGHHGLQREDRRARRRLPCRRAVRDHRSGHRPARCRRNRSPRSTRMPVGPASGRHRGPHRPVHPRQHRPARGHQPAVTVVTRGDRPHPRSCARWIRATASRPRSAVQRPAATTSSCRRRRAPRTRSDSPCSRAASSCSCCSAR